MIAFRVTLYGGLGFRFRYHKIRLRLPSYNLLCRYLRVKLIAFDRNVRWHMGETVVDEIIDMVVSLVWRM